jgi:hypothetical protein
LLFGDRHGRGLLGSGARAGKPRKEDPINKLLAVATVALVALSGAASTALAHSDARSDRAANHKRAHKKPHRRGKKRDNHRRSFKCNGRLSGVTIKSDLVVPQNAACTLTKATIKGNVAVQKNAYLQAGETSIRGDVRANGAQAVFIDTGSTLAGKLETDKTAQVFAFNSTINGGIGISGATDKVNVCGNTVKGEGITILRSSRDILVGDPLAVDCGGNKVVGGSVLIGQNDTDVELVVRGNVISKGSLFVLNNTGPAAKFVQSNTGGKTLRCTGNSATFTGAPNPSWQQYQGQCRA